MPDPNAISTNVNWREIQNQLSEEITDSLAKIINGARADVIEFGTAIARDTVNAMAHTDIATRDSMLKELRGQLRTIAELNRVRVSNEVWERMDSALNLGINVAVRMIGLIAV